MNIYGERDYRVMLEKQLAQNKSSNLTHIYWVPAFYTVLYHAFHWIRIVGKIIHAF